MHCLCFTYRPLVRVEVVGEAAHVGGGRGAQTLGVEEWRERRPAATLRTLLLVLLSAGPEVGDVIASPGSLSTFRLALISQELNLNLKWMLEITASKQFNSNKSEYAQIIRKCPCGNFGSKFQFPIMVIQFIEGFLYSDLNVLTISVCAVSGKMTVPSD